MADVPAAAAAGAAARRRPTTIVGSIVGDSGSGAKRRTSVGRPDGVAAPPRPRLDLDRDDGARVRPFRHRLDAGLPDSMAGGGIPRRRARRRRTLASSRGGRPSPASTRDGPPPKGGPTPVMGGALSTSIALERGAASYPRIDRRLDLTSRVRSIGLDLGIRQVQLDLTSVDVRSSPISLISHMASD